VQEGGQLLVFVQAGNAEDSFQKVRILCNQCSTWDAAADGISDGLQVI